MIIIQARLSSARFPGKVLYPLGGRPIIDWVLEACLQSKRHKFVCLATPDTQSHDQLWKHVRSSFPDVIITAGSEGNVHGRFTEALLQHQQFLHNEPEEVGVVRVCADRPFLSTLFIDALCHEKDSDHLLYNHVPPPGLGGPRGLGAESLSKSLATEFFRSDTALSKYDQEHVTSALYRDRALAPRFCPPPNIPPELSKWDCPFDIDERTDMPWIEALAASRLPELLALDANATDTQVERI